MEEPTHIEDDLDYEEYYNRMVDQAATLVLNANRIVFYTGAGMSAESGIATFRSDSDSFWSGIRGKLAMVYFGTPWGWYLTPQLAFRTYIREFYTPILQAKPNAGHIAISDLQKAFPPYVRPAYAMPVIDTKFTLEDAHRVLEADNASRSYRPNANINKNIRIVTTNVDGLHQTAGSPDTTVYEIHGTVRNHRCIAGGHPMNFSPDLKIPKVGTPDDVPMSFCQKCGSVPRPNCVLFGEPLPYTIWSEAYLTTVSLSPSRDVIFVIGSSGVVYPAASLPETAHSRGVNVIEINLEPSPISGKQNVLFIQGKVSKILPRIVARVAELRETAVRLGSLRF